MSHTNAHTKKTKIKTNKQLFTASHMLPAKIDVLLGLPRVWKKNTWLEASSVTWCQQEKRDAEKCNKKEVDNGLFSFAGAYKWPPSLGLFDLED